MAKMLKSPEAKADLLDIGQYIAEQSHSEATALRFLNTIEDRCNLLARHPLAGETRPDLAPKV